MLALPPGYTDGMPKKMTPAEFVAEAQAILDRAKLAGDTVLIDIYTREVIIRNKIIQGV